MINSEIPKSLRVETRKDLIKKLDEISTFRQEDYISGEEFWNKFDDFRHRARQREVVNA